MARAPALHAGSQRFKSSTAQSVSIEAVNNYTSERHFFRFLSRCKYPQDCEEMLICAKVNSTKTEGFEGGKLQHYTTFFHGFFSSILSILTFSLWSVKKKTDDLFGHQSPAPPSSAYY